MGCCLGPGVSREGAQTVQLALGFYNDERLIWKIFAACGKRERERERVSEETFPHVVIVAASSTFTSPTSSSRFTLPERSEGAQCSPMITKLSFFFYLGATGGPCHFLLMAPVVETGILSKINKNDCQAMEREREERERANKTETETVNQLRSHLFKLSFSLFFSFAESHKMLPPFSILSLFLYSP